MGDGMLLALPSPDPMGRVPLLAWDLPLSEQDPLDHLRDRFNPRPRPLLFRRSEEITVPRASRTRRRRTRNLWLHPGSCRRQTRIHAGLPRIAPPSLASFAHHRPRALPRRAQASGLHDRWWAIEVGQTSVSKSPRAPVQLRSPSLWGLGICYQFARSGDRLTWGLDDQLGAVE